MSDAVKTEEELSPQEKMAARFEKERTKVSKEVYENIGYLTKLTTLGQAQVNMLSLRQRLLEDNHTRLDHITKLRKEYRKKRALALEQLSSNQQYRFQSKEKDALVDGKISETKQWLEMFENQVQFFNDTMRTVDNIIFGLKTRLDIEKTIGM